MDEDRLLTVNEVAEILRANPETVRRWLREGVLPGFRPGGKRLGYRVWESELRRWLAEGETAAGELPAAVGSAR